MMTETTARPSGAEESFWKKKIPLGQTASRASLALIGRGVYGRDLWQLGKGFGALLLLTLGFVFLSKLDQAMDLDVLPHVDGEDCGRLIVSFAFVTAFVLGLISTAEEEDSETRFFADRLPIGRWRLAGEKIGALITLVVAWPFVALVLMFVMLALIEIFTFGVLDAFHIGADTSRFFLFSLFALDGGELLRLVPVVIAVAMTGMLAGAWVTNGVVQAALAGTGLLLVFKFVAAHLDGPNSVSQNLLGSYFMAAPSATPGAAIVAVVWAPIAAVLTGWRFAIRHEAEEGWRLPRFQFWTDTFAPPLDVPYPHRMPHRHATRWPLIAGVVVAFLSIPFRQANNPLSTLGTDVFDIGFWIGNGIFFAVLGAFLGTACVKPRERDGARFFGAALPVPLGRQFLSRCAASGRMALILAAVHAIVTAYATHEMAGRELRASATGGLDGGVLYFAFAMMAFVMLLNGALFGILARLFLRAYLIAVIPAALCALFWGFYGSARTLGSLGGSSSTHLPTLAQGWWPALVLIGLPMLAIWIAVEKSPLLEAGEGRRALAMLAVLPVLTIWGLFLIGTSPIDLLIILF